MKKFLKMFFTVIASAFIGIINGFFGGGGGMLCVPFLQKALRLDSKKSHATAIAVIAPITLVSAAAYLYEGAAPLPDLYFAIGGVLIGGIAGALLLKKLPAWLIGGAFALLMIVAGVKMIIG